MANPYQQQVFQRKLIYVGLIIALLAASWSFRLYGVEARARKLGLLEESRGDVELLGAAARTSLSGLRGIATCALWMQAMREQEKNQYSSLERTVKQLTRLQPHLMTPWIFQSWNLAFNVSKESDRVADKYFYITRGIQLLAQGERQNQYQPEMRREIGFYNQVKLSHSDERNTFRSLFQLSCIPPARRDPDKFRSPDGTIKFDELQQFCQEHPQLVRRLHSPPLPYELRPKQRKFRCANAAELVQFLADNFNVPSLYADKLDSEKDFKEEKPRDNPLDRFPVLPPRFVGKQVPRIMFNPEDPTAESLVLQRVPDEYDPYLVARAWYGYSQECIPPPGQFPGEPAPITEPGRQRVPRNMMTAIFRTGPARAQTSMADRLQEEGWFDGDQFELEGWFTDPRSGRGRKVLVGEHRQWSADAWHKAHLMWRKFGDENKLRFEVESQRDEMEKKSLAFRKKFRMRDNEMTPKIDPAQLEANQDLYDAFQYMIAYHTCRHFTAFPQNLIRSGIEEQPRTVTARKLFYLGEQLRVVKQDLNQALEKFEDPACLPAWRDILEQNPEYRKDDFIMEQSFEMELKHIRLYRRLHEDKLAPDLALLAVLGQSATGAPLGADWTMLGLFSKPQLQPEFTVVGLLDKDSKGVPFIFPEVKNEVLVRRGLKKAAPTGPPGEGPPPGMQPPPGP